MYQSIFIYGIQITITKHIHFFDDLTIKLYYLLEFRRFLSSLGVKVYLWLRIHPHLIRNGSIYFGIDSINVIR